MSEPLFSSVPLRRGWCLVRSEPGSAGDPGAVDWSDAIEDAAVPGTVASTLLGRYDPDRPPHCDYDDYDWWYRVEFEADRAAALSELLFDGLATIAEAWLNGDKILESRNMFREFRADVSGRVGKRNVLVIVFRSLNHNLGQKRKRPRWKTALVENQQLRWVRATLLGRIPGWTPAIRPVGPWRDIRLVQSAAIRIDELDVVPSIDDAGPSVNVNGVLRTAGAQIESASLSILGSTYTLDVASDGDSTRICGRLRIDDAPSWSAHDPQLHDYALSISMGKKDRVLNEGRLGFRSVTVDRSGGSLCFQVNGRDVFCRGACWTTGDILSLRADAKSLGRDLAAFREAGGNMIRVGGTMVYECDDFYRLCDELGIMVWQDFMFANMDYPATDAGFLDDVKAEITYQVRRLRKYACVVAYCGNSEVEQQAAMLGMTPDMWRSELFYVVIAGLLEKECPGIPYFASSPSEGALPFHVATGPSHYFGIGAYRQPLDSIETARVTFTSECLAFSNVPSDRSMIRHFGTALPQVHHPKWKSGVPRDAGAGWDFEDVRDHYLGELYGLDPAALRFADKERYIAISKVVTGEVMMRAFDYWRSPDSSCNGALVWQLRDIVPGAGWGLLDSDGRPKPVLYFLRRCWGDVSLVLRDRGMDGLELVVVNDTPDSVSATLDIKVLQHSKIVIAQQNKPLEVGPRSHTEIGVDEWLGRFLDSAYRYRFGPPKHDVVVATLQVHGTGEQLIRCFFPNGWDIRRIDSADVEIDCRSNGAGVQVEIRSGVFLQHVELQSRTHDFDDNYFHVAPDVPRKVLARKIVETDRPIRGTMSALNLSHPISFG